MGNYRQLKVWTAGHQLALDVYRITRHFPQEERYGITSQLRRAAVSIPSNIAEGAGRNSAREFARYCRISLGSANEVDYHLLLARDIEYIAEDDHRRLEGDVARIRRMLSRLADRLERPADSR